MAGPPLETSMTTLGVALNNLVYWKVPLPMAELIFKASSNPNSSMIPGFTQVKVSLENLDQHPLTPSVLWVCNAEMTHGNGKERPVGMFWPKLAHHKAGITHAGSFLIYGITMQQAQAYRFPVYQKDFYMMGLQHPEVMLEREALCLPQPDCLNGTKTLANPDKNHFLAKARRNSFLTTMPISPTFWCHKRNEINIRQTLGIDIRKEPSRNETTRLDEIREGHRKEIRTIQPTLDTWTA
ncbi:hypothetical protein HGM15179_007472 [Zosterops borbonicus]|uniref:Uncharacterized protein n=1 Tax=Zosterops borbonicus TaxID=364589 RepID=A0A8K1GIK1_9PASS|nr:hypothetical protein HGM15179_007472 [Zosterops borbonicus]